MRWSFFPVAFGVCALALCATDSQHTGPSRLRAEGRRLVAADGTTFDWRGVTAFRLIDHLADHREADAVAYLDWARAAGFNVVRVLTRLDGWADLPAAEGQRLLPRVLTLAAARALYVEAVATVGSGSTPYDWRGHARAIAEICAQHDNCLYEFANEPGHPSQAAELHDMGAVDRFAAEATTGLAPLLWTAGPSWDGHTSLVPTGRYVVRHLDRAGEAIEQLARLRDLADLSRRTGKYVVSDEPTGADEVPGAQSGRQRWHQPDLFFAMGALCRGFGLGCTFHLQDGLATVVPANIQQQSARAFGEGWRALPETQRFADVADAESPVASIDGKSVVAAPSFLTPSPGDAFVVILHRATPLAPGAITLREGWSRAAVISQRPQISVWRVTGK